MTEHKRIWLEPAGAPDRCWCQDNQWDDDGVEYVLASEAATLLLEQQAEIERLQPVLEWAQRQQRKPFGVTTALDAYFAARSALEPKP